MLINKKQIKEVAKSYNKRVSNEFFERLNKECYNIVITACVNARNFKTLKIGDYKWRT